jgi:hypothetical protein
MKKIFNIQNRIVARADKTMDEATVIIELSVHMWMVAFEVRVGYLSSTYSVSRPVDTEPSVPW